VSYKAIRIWCIKFGAKYARELKRKHQGFGDTFYIDEVFVKINGKSRGRAMIDRSRLCGPVSDTVSHGMR
jgi:transposase-like protein